jgi:hypothetical protein
LSKQEHEGQEALDKHIEQTAPGKKSVRDVIYTDRKITDIAMKPWKAILKPEKAEGEDAPPVFVAKHSKLGITSLVMTGLSIVLLILFVALGRPAIKAIAEAGMTVDNFMNGTVPNELFNALLFPAVSFLAAMGLIVVSLIVGLAGVLQRKKRITRLASLSVLILLVMIIVLILLFVFL